MSTIRLGAIFLIVGSIISLIFSLLWIIGPQPEVGANIFEKFGQQSLKSGTSTKIFSLLQSFPLLHPVPTLGGPFGDPWGPLGTQSRQGGAWPSPAPRFLYFFNF